MTRINPQGPQAGRSEVTSVDRTTDERVAELRRWAADPTIPDDEWAAVTVVTMRALLEDMSLDKAWAGAEAALPEGWAIRGLAHGSPSDETEWVAAAGTMPFWEAPSALRGYGPTPAAALHALVVSLRAV